MRIISVDRLMALTAAVAVAITVATTAAPALGAQYGDPGVGVDESDPGAGVKVASDAHDDEHRGWYRDQWPVRGVRIAAVEEGGTTITLRDGTVWEVYLPHRTSTVEWRRGDYVTVKPSPLGQDVGSGRYTFELFNGRAESLAVVKFKGKRAPGRRG